MTRTLKEIPYIQASHYLAEGLEVFSGEHIVSPKTKWKKVNGEIASCADDGNESWRYSVPTPDQINGAWFMESKKDSEPINKQPNFPELARGGITWATAFEYMKQGWTFEKENYFPPTLVRYFNNGHGVIEISNSSGQEKFWSASPIIDFFTKATYKLRFDIKQNKSVAPLNEAVNHPGQYSEFHDSNLTFKWARAHHLMAEKGLVVECCANQSLWKIYDGKIHVLNRLKKNWEAEFPSPSLLSSQWKVGCLSEAIAPMNEKSLRISDDNVNHPAHYHPGQYEAIKVIRAWGLDSNFNLGNVVKYISRCNSKHESPLEDLKKALWYLQDEIKHMESK